MAVAYQGITTRAFSNFSTGPENINLPASTASGDLLIFAYAFYSSGGSITLSGGTQFMSEAAYQENRYMGGWFKYADATDISNGYVTISGDAGHTKFMGGALIRVTGVTYATPIIDNFDSAVGSPTGTYENTITQLGADSLLIMIASKQGNYTASGYAIATSNPSWTEVADFNGLSSGQYTTLEVAHATRTEITATGDSTVVFSAGNEESGCILLSVVGEASVNVTGEVGSLALNGNSGTPTGGANVTGTVGELPLVGNSGAVTTPASKYTNTNKSSTSNFTNTTKS